MLPKNRRLTRQEFWKVKTQGKNLSNVDASVYWLANTLEFSRFAVIVSTKLSKKAVVRNRLRRRIYRLLNAEPQIDVIIYPRPSMLNLNDEQIRTSLDSLLSKIS